MNRPRTEYEMMVDDIKKSSTHTIEDKLLSTTILLVKLLLDLRDKIDENHENSKR